MGPDAQATDTAPTIPAPNVLDGQPVTGAVGPPDSLHPNAPRFTVGPPTTSSIDLTGGFGSPISSDAVSGTPAPIGEFGSTSSAAPIVSPEFNSSSPTPAPTENLITNSIAAPGQEIPSPNPSAPIETTGATPPTAPAAPEVSNGLFPSSPAESVTPTSFEIPPISPSTSSSQPEISPSLDMTSPTSSEAASPVMSESPSPIIPTGKETDTVTIPSPSVDSASQSPMDTMGTQPTAPPVENPMLQPMSDEPLSVPPPDALSGTQTNSTVEDSASATATGVDTAPIALADGEEVSSSEIAADENAIEKLASVALNPEKVSGIIDNYKHNLRELGVVCQIFTLAASLGESSKTEASSITDSTIADPSPLASTS